MKKLTPDQEALLHEVMKGTLPYPDFLEKIGVQIDMALCLDLLSTYKQKNDLSKFEGVLYALVAQLSSDEKRTIYSKELTDLWHHEHEEIANAFQTDFNDDPKNIEVLLNAMENIPEYLQHEDFKYPYLRKIIYAIGAQPNPHNLEALEKLTFYEDEKIRELAVHQLDKRKKLGRWEADKLIK